MAAPPTLYAHLFIRAYDPAIDHDVDGDGRFVSEVDDDPRTRKRHLTYEQALFHLIRILTSYGGEE